MICILVVHHVPLVANLMVSVLSDEEDINVVRQVHSADDALKALSHSPCDIVLVAGDLPDNGALYLTETLNKEHPNTKVLVIGLPKNNQIILQYVMAGASGYVLQNVDVDHLVENVRAVYKDRALVSPDMAAFLMNQIRELAQAPMTGVVDASLVTTLTPRECDVLNLIGEGLTNQEIAESLFIEVGTVKNHVHNLLNKLEASNRQEAAAYLPYLET